MAERITQALLLFQGIVCIYALITGHPFQLAYYNCLAGRPVAEEFEYASTTLYKQALEEILKMDVREEILISSDNMVCYHGIKQAWEILSPEKKARIQIAKPGTEECGIADYHVYGESTLRKENMMIENGLDDAERYQPEEKFDSQLGLDAYGYRMITIYYNNH